MGYLDVREKANETWMGKEHGGEEEGEWRSRAERRGNNPPGGKGKDRCAINRGDTRQRMKGKIKKKRPNRFIEF
jgi:hypothetical protein